MAFAIDSEQLLRWAQIAMSVVALGVLVTWLVLFALRIKHRRQAAERKVLQQQWQKVLFTVCVAPELVSLSESDVKRLWHDPQAFLWFLQLWSQMHQYVRGEADDGLEFLAREVKLEREALQLMRGQSIRTLISTAIALGDLQQLSEASIKRLRQLTKHESSMVVLTALRALMRHDQPTAVRILLKLDNYIAPERLVTIANECQPDYLISEAQKALLKDSPKHAAYLLRVLQGIDILLPEDTADLLLKHFAKQPEVVAQIVPLLDHPRHIARVRRLTQSSNVGVRVQATRLLASLADDLTDFERLWQLLQDSNWWVRYRAAQGILGHPQFTNEMIKEQLTELADPYAVKMLEQVRGELAVGEANEH